MSIGAHVMNSLADALVNGPTGRDRRSQAEAWVQKALDVIKSAKANAKSDDPAVGECESVLVAALFNMGSLREVGVSPLPSSQVLTT